MHCVLQKKINLSDTQKVLREGAKFKFTEHIGK